MSAPSNSHTSYLPPEVIDYPGKWLVAEDAAGPHDVFLFFNRVEIGRFHEKRRLPGMLLVNDQTVSSRHCVITQEPDGRCFIRDMSCDFHCFYFRRVFNKTNIFNDFAHLNHFRMYVFL